MKKWLTGVLLTLLMVFAASAAMAAEAVDITDECTMKGPSKFKYTQMTDKKYTSYWDSHKTKNP